MQKKSFEITLIGYGLAIVYGLGLFIYLWAFIDPEVMLGSSFFAGKFASVQGLQKHAAILWLLYAPQVVGFIAVAGFKEWGRKLVIGMNMLMCVYVLYRLFAAQQPVDFLSAMSILIYIVIILFFSQAKIKAHFEDHGIAPLLNKRVLVVDDDRGLLKMVKATLVPHGFDVFLAETGEQGLKMAKKKIPMLIILDVILPGIKGREVCARLKEDDDTRKIPVIFLTSKDSPDDVRAEIEAGAITHLTKPINSQKLIIEVKRILGL